MTKVSPRVAGLRFISLLGSCMLLSGCIAVGPDYVKPAVITPAAFKEKKNWKIAQPGDAIDRGQWWGIFHDPQLDRLMEQIDIGNQNLRVYEAAFKQAQAEVQAARANLYPTVTGAPTITRQRASGTNSTTLSLEGTASWEPDIWGKVRRQIESNVANAQASAAELASIRLSAQATVATDYFALRYEDSLQQLYKDTIKAYERTLDITRNQYASGVAARSDVVQAETQLQTTKALAIAVGLDRAKYEHAIALLIGKPPSDLSIAFRPLSKAVPQIPVALPSTLLERRPDIAQAERAVQQQSELIGVAVAAYYPTIDLTGAVGVAGDPSRTFFKGANVVWSAVGSASETIFDAGARAAAVDEAQASTDQAVATYRQTVLAAFQDVEDEIVSQRILATQYKVQGIAVDSSRKAVEIAINEYRAGTQAYTTVVTAQATALSNEQTLLGIQSNRVAAAVSLVRALGGGWNSISLPMERDL